jgi:uncharacterized membrane protein
MITIAAVVWVAGFLAGLIGPGTLVGKALERLGLQFASDTTLAYLFGWILVLAAIFLLGVLVEIGAKRLIQGGIDGLANRVPFLGGVYGTARQLVGMMDKKESADLKGMSVVFCIFGKESGAAFLALLPTPQRFRIDNVDYHAVIVPTAPVPVGGSLIFVPAKSVRPANLSVDAFMSIYVSMGVTGPQFLAGGKDTGV